MRPTRPDRYNVKMVYWALQQYNHAFTCTRNIGINWNFGKKLQKIHVIKMNVGITDYSFNMYSNEQPAYKFIQWSVGTLNPPSSRLREDKMSKSWPNCITTGESWTNRNFWHFGQVNLGLIFVFFSAIYLLNSIESYGESWQNIKHYHGSEF